MDWPDLIIFVFPVIIFLFVKGIQYYLDKQRIREYLASKNCRLTNMPLNFLDPGLMLARNERIYTIHFENWEKHIFKAYAKTGPLAGVYFSEVSEVRQKSPDW